MEKTHLYYNNNRENPGQESKMIHFPNRRVKNNENVETGVI